MHYRTPQVHVMDDGRLDSEIQYVRAANLVMRGVERAVDQLAASDVPILLVGEPGTGKRTLALRLHKMSARSSDFFSEIAAANVTAEWLEELTAEVPGRNGMLVPVRGTLFLSEIADLAANFQPWLLENLSPERNGAQKSAFRLVASSRHNLDQAMTAGRFREDLFYRIGVVGLRVPPLRHRREDIPVLCNHFLETYSLLFRRVKPELSQATWRFLLEHNWPGNVRELEDTIKTIVAVGDERIAMTALRSSNGEGRRGNGLTTADTLSLKQAARAASRQAERELILKVLTRTRWNRKRAAQELQISYKALLYKLKQIGLDDEVMGREENTL